MKTSRCFQLLLLLAALLWLPGCASYYLVQSRFVVGERVTEVPEVTETRLYSQVRGAVQAVALRPPDNCEDRGVSKIAGEAEFRGDVLRTSCGVEMAEVEKALAKGGFLVVSWGAIKDRASAQKVSSLRAAEDLDVDVLLQVNSLERSRIEPRLDARWERRFYHSSRAAEVGAPASVVPELVRIFEKMIVPEEARLSPGTRLAATIDANAVLVANKASIWFYRWTLVDAPSKDPLARVHVRCDSDVCVRQPKSKPEVPGARVEGTIAPVSLGAQATDMDPAVYHRLTRRLVEDMVSRFAGTR